MPKFRKERDMNFKDAFKAMKTGAKVKLPSWGGYWILGCGKAINYDAVQTERH